MPEPVKNDNANATVEESTARGRMSLRRRLAQGVGETESKVERPNTVPVFQASPTNVAGALAKHGVPLEATLVWGQDDQGGPVASTSMPVPVFIVGAGRDLLGGLLHQQADVHVGSHGELIAERAQAIQRNWSSLAREGYPEQYWFKKLGDEFCAERSAESGGRRWVEVVDTRVVSLETLDRVFPRCVVVNVVPRWLQGGVRPTRRSRAIPAQRFFEVRMADVKATPDVIGREILEFLGGAAA